jgi:hypothetical protein
MTTNSNSADRLLLIVHFCGSDLDARIFDLNVRVPASEAQAVIGECVEAFNMALSRALQKTRGAHGKGRGGAAKLSLYRKPQPEE